MSLGPIFSLLPFLATFFALTTCRGELPDDHVALFIFGDSLFDVGNNYYTTHPPPRPNFPPYGETFLPYATGRTSDGRLVPDFIAQIANLTLIPPYLQGDTNYTNGANFASAGSGVLSETGSEGVINLNSQLGYFRIMVEKLKEQLGEDDAQKLLSNAVYLFSAGGNDIMSLLMMQAALTSSDEQEYMLTVLGNFTIVIGEVYNNGGRKFGIQNVGPLGCSPASRSQAIQTITPHCVEGPQTLATEYNSLLSQHLEWLTTHLPNFKYSLFDYYTSLMERTLYYSYFGFREGFSACCGSGLYNGHFTCGNEAENYTLCMNPSEFVWFDPAHPTERTNMQLAKLFWSGDHSLTWPNNLSSLFKTSSLSVEIL